jgi:hypothetical protein
MATRFLSWVVLALALAAPVVAQTAATVRVLVEDETRYALYAAVVTITNLATQETREARTDSSGRVVFQDLPPGDYTIRASASGFDATEAAIRLDGSPLPIQRLTLHLEDISEDVTITGGSRSADRTAAEQNADALNIDDDILRAVPVPLSSQSLMNYIATYLTGAAMGTDEVSLLIDGVQSTALNIPLSAVRRILVNKNPYNAEYRRPGKARVEILTMDGSRRHYHGLAGFSFGDNRFDARNARADSKPDGSRNLVELSFGGPLFGSSASYFASYERLDEMKHRIVRALTPDGPVNTLVDRPSGGTLSVGRLDVRPSITHRLTFRYDLLRDWKKNSGAGGFNLPELAIDDKDTQDEVRFAWSSIFSPGLGNEFRAAAERKRAVSGRLPSGYRYKVTGAFESGSNQDYSTEHADSVEIQNAMTYYHGAHAFRFGGRIRPKWVDMADFSDSVGTYSFSSLATYVAGAPFSFSAVRGAPHVRFTQHEIDVFFQDEIKPRHDISLMLGVRYDWQNAIRHDTNNVSPRIALSYSLSPKTILRAGSGLFYERLSEKAVQRTNLYNGIGTREILISNPSFPNPDAEGELSLIPTSIYRLSPELETPYLVQHSVSLERELWPRTLFTVEYGRMRGVSLFRATDANAPLPGVGLRPDPNFTRILQVNSHGSMKSDGIALSFRGRAGGWFKGTAFYSYSRSYSNVAGAEPGAGFPFELPPNSYDLSQEWGSADFDTRHRFNMTTVIELPLAIRIGGILQAYSGAPYDVMTGFDSNLDGLANERPHGVPRNARRGPGFKQVDVRLAKLFYVGSEGALEFQVDAINVLNFPNYSAITNVMTSPFFGQPNAAGDPRLLQFAVKFSF